MRPEQTPWAGPKTWLLATVAGWALCIWALGLFGLGGRIEPLPEDPALLQRLPQPGAPAKERLGPIGQYAEIGARPVFSEDRKPHPFFIDPGAEGEVQDEFAFVLTSVLLTPRLAMAIVQPTEGGESVRLKVGEAPDDAPGWTLASVAARSAVFNGPEGQQTLELRVFDGVGGEAPTAAAVVPADGAAQPAPMPTLAGQRQGPARMPAVVPPKAPAPLAQGAPADVGVAADPAEVPAEDPEVEAQTEAIRQRIEARRAQLLQQSRQAVPKQTP